MILKLPCMVTEQIREKIRENIIRMLKRNLNLLVPSFFFLNVTAVQNLLFEPTEGDNHFYFFFCIL